MQVAPFKVAICLYGIAVASLASFLVLNYAPMIWFSFLGNKLYLVTMLAAGAFFVAAALATMVLTLSPTKQTWN
jgi:hypothetical protein